MTIYQEIPLWVTILYISDYRWWGEKKKWSLLEETWLRLDIYDVPKGTSPLPPPHPTAHFNNQKAIPKLHWTVNSEHVPPGPAERPIPSQEAHVQEKHLYFFSVATVPWPLFWGQVHCFQELWASRCLSSQLRELPEQFSLLALLRFITLTWTTFSWDRKSLHEIGRTIFMDH